MTHKPAPSSIPSSGEAALPFVIRNSSFVIAAKRPPGFTLIELLIVVMIIAILAAIAIPNFLEAQTRAKVARARADLRSIATGLESYRVDLNHYPPNDGAYSVIPFQLTTPVAYLSTSKLHDPFTEKDFVFIPGIDPELAKFYTYTKPVTMAEFQSLVVQGGAQPPVEGVDGDDFNLGAYARYGHWRLLSNGPDRIYSKGSPPPPPIDPFNPRSVLKGADIPYDATNGTVSFGNVLRVQRSEECRNPL